MTEEVVAGMKRGTLEVECTVRKADGTVKSVERVKKNVEYRLDQTGEQIVELQEV